MTTAQVLRHIAVHAAMAGVVCVGLKGLVVVDTKTLFGPTLYWAFIFLVGGVSVFWLHLINDVRNLKAFMEIFEMDRDKYKIKRYEYMLHKLAFGGVSGKGDTFFEFDLYTNKVVYIAMRGISYLIGFVLITMSFNILPGLAIFSIILAAMIVTIRQATQDLLRRGSAIRVVIDKLPDFLSYAGGMFAAAMIVYTVTHAASQ